MSENALMLLVQLHPLCTSAIGQLVQNKQAHRRRFDNSMNFFLQKHFVQLVRRRKNNEKLKPLPRVRKDTESFCAWSSSWLDQSSQACTVPSLQTMLFEAAENDALAETEQLVPEEEEDSWQLEIFSSISPV